jgi:hypothetical protein
VERGHGPARRQVGGAEREAGEIDREEP